MTRGYFSLFIMFILSLILCYFLILSHLFVDASGIGGPSSNLDKNSYSSMISSFGNLDLGSKLESKVFSTGTSSSVPTTTTSYFTPEKTIKIFGPIPEIHTIVTKDLKPKVPKSAISLKSNHNSNKLLREIIFKGMKGSKLSSKEMKIFTFWNENILNQLALGINKKELELANCNPFQHDFGTLFSNYNIYLKQEKVLKDIDKTLEKASKNIQKIISMIKEKVYLNIPFHQDFKMMNAYYLEFFYPLIFKVSKYFDHLAPSQVEALKYFYSLLKSAFDFFKSLQQLKNAKLLQRRAWNMVLKSKMPISL